MLRKTFREGGVPGYYKYGANDNYGAADFDNGKNNTEKFKNKPDFNYAAWGCINYRGGNYEDWYLPSLNELKELQNFRDLLGLSDRGGPVYWSSTESDEERAYSESFGGLMGQPGRKTSAYKVRPIRSF